MKKPLKRIPKKIVWKSKKPRTYSWSYARGLLFSLVRKYLPKLFIDKNNNRNYISDCDYEMGVSDLFHPWDTDGELERALNKDTNKWGEIDEAIVSCFNEIFERIYEHYSNPMNHPPGYVVPKMLKMDYHFQDILQPNETDIKKFIREVYKK